MKRIPNVIGFNLQSEGGPRRLKDALSPYLNYPEVEREHRSIRMYVPAYMEPQVEAMCQETATS